MNNEQIVRQGLIVGSHLATVLEDVFETSHLDIVVREGLRRYSAPTDRYKWV